MGSTGDRRKPVTATKPFTIPKRLVYEAFKAVKANAGSAGVDKEPDVVWKLLPAARQGGGHFRRRMAGKGFSAFRRIAHNAPHAVWVWDVDVR